MAWVMVGFAITAVGLALKLMTMKSALTRASFLLKNEREKTESLLALYEELRDRADERIKQLKKRNYALLETNIKNSKPGDIRSALNDFSLLHENNKS